MKKLIFIVVFLTLIIGNYNCGVNDGNEKLYRRQIIVESNLSSFQLGSTYYDSTSIFPYVLDDITTPNTLNYFSSLTIYPIPDTGFIKFIIYGGEGNTKPIQLQLKDALFIATPVDTTNVFFQNYSTGTF